MCITCGKPLRNLFFAKEEVVEWKEVTPRHHFRQLIHSDLDGSVKILLGCPDLRLWKTVRSRYIPATFFNPNNLGDFLVSGR